MKSQYSSFEVTLSIDQNDKGQLAILNGLLIRLGVLEQNITELIDGNRSCLSVYFSSSKKGLKLKRKLQNCRLKKVTIQSKTIRSKDWQNLWKKDYKPFQLTHRFEIVPFGYRRQYRPKKRQPIYIDTSYAFGTGLHATTRFMANFIDRCAGRFETFLDIGTGTGILSIIALQCGAKNVQAIDLRKDIIQIANINFRENGFSNQKARAINFDKVITKNKYDYVAANLITQDLIVFKKKLVSLVKVGKYLALSGISLNNYPLFRKNFDSMPLRCIKIEKGEGWYALLYKKIK